MKTYETPYVLSELESSRLLACEEKEISIVLGDDAYHNLRISLQHAKMLLAEGKYDRIYYINLPFSGKRFAESYKAAGISDDERLIIYHVSNGSLADTIREIRQRMDHNDEMGNTAIIINSWEMSSRSFRHREDLVFAIYMMHMKSEATFFVYSVAESKHIILRRSSRGGFGRLIHITDDVVDLATGKYTVAKKEKEKMLYLSDAVYYPEGPERDDFLRRHEEQQKRLRGEEEAKNSGAKDQENTEVEQYTKDESAAIETSGVGVNLDDRKINELPIDVAHTGKEGKYRQAA